MRTRARSFLHLLLVVAAIFLSTTSSSADEALRIGVIAPLSGAWGAIGQRVVNGATLAAEELSRSGREIHLVVEDSRFNAREGISAFRKMELAEGIDALVVSDSISLDALAPLLRSRGLPVIHVAEMGSEPTRDNLFQLSEEFKDCGGALARYLNTIAPKRVVVLTAEVRAYDRVYEEFAAVAHFPFKRINVAPDDANLRGVIPSILAYDPERLVIMASPSQSGAFVREYRLVQKKMTPLLFEEDLLIDWSSFVEVAGDPHVVDDAYVGVIERAKDAGFIERYRHRFNEEPEYGEYGFDAVSVLSKTFSPDRASWIASLGKFVGHGATGEISFDERGVRRGTTAVITVADAVRSSPDIS